MARHIWKLAALPLAVATLLGSPAGAQSFSVRPTTFVGNPQPFADATAQLHLGTTATTPELLPGLTVEGELSLLIVPSTAAHDASIALADNSSYLRLHWQPASWNRGEGLSFTLLPLHSDRLYLGYEFPLADTLELFQTGPVTGAELRLERERWYAFTSVKSEVVEDAQDHNGHREATFFAGGGVDLFSAVRIEAEGAHADHGVNPEPQVLGEAVHTWGAAAQLTYHRGLPIGPQTDFRLYRRDPAVWEKLMRPELYDDRLSAQVAGELLYAYMTGLASPTQYGATAAAPALGYALDARLKWRRTRFYLRAQYRSASLLQFDAPGFPPFYALPDDSAPVGEIDGRVAVDHFFERVRLTPGLELGVSRPASLTVSSQLGGTNPLPGFAQSETVVIEDTNTFDILAAGTSPSPTWLAKLTLRFDTAWLSAIGEAYAFYDPNRTTFADNVVGTSKPVPAPGTTFAFDVLVQARF